MYKLFQSSWRDDALVKDAKRGVYSEIGLIQGINHHGEHFQVSGPHICQPLPQQAPVLLEAGTLRAGKLFAAQHAEAFFVASHSPSVVVNNIAEIKEAARTQSGGDPQNTKFLEIFCSIIGRTQERFVA